MGSSCSTNVQNHSAGAATGTRHQSSHHHRPSSTQDTHFSDTWSEEFVYTTPTDQPRRTNRPLQTQDTLGNGAPYTTATHQPRRPLRPFPAQINLSNGLYTTTTHQPRNPLRPLQTQIMRINGSALTSARELPYTTGRHQPIVIVDAYPRPRQDHYMIESLLTRDTAGWLPLHCACSGGRVHDALNLLSLFPQTARVTTTRMKRTPLSLVCKRSVESHETIELIQTLVSLYPEATMICDESGMLPIDYYFQQRRRHKEVLKLLVSPDTWAPGATRTNMRGFGNQPAAITKLRKIFLTPDGEGNLPLHKACMGDYPGLPFYLLHRCPEAARILTMRGRRSALSLACDRPGVQPELVQWLVSIYPEALTISSNGMLPLHYAWNNDNLDILPYLTRGNVGRELLVSEARHNDTSNEAICGTNRLSIVQWCDTCDEVQTICTSEESVPECCICLEPLYRNISRSISCGHEFHTHCINRQLSSPCSNCPLCRAQISRDVLSVIR